MPNETPSAVPAGPRRRRLLFRAVALLFALSIALVLGEVAVRIVRPQATMFTGSGLYMADPELGHRLRPGKRSGGVSINSHGFRDREYAVRKPEGVYRVMGIGDSFTFGAGPRADNFLDILEERLAQESGPRFEVINTGVPAYNTRQAAAMLRRYGLRFDPDLVILAFFLGNDIAENATDPVLRVVDGELTHEQPTPTERVLARSHLWRLLRSVFAGTVRADEKATTEISNFLAVEGARLAICEIATPPLIETGYQKSEERIRALARELREKRIGFLVLLIPDEFQVSEPLRDELQEAFDLDWDRYDLELPNRRLGAFLEEEEIPFVDILELLRERQRETPVYITRNTHLNREGNEVAAGALLQKMRETVPALETR